MKKLFSLGEIYPSDFLAPGEEPTTDKVEMKLIMDNDGLVRLEKTAPMSKMYGKYWYRSGINETMRNALKDVVDSILKVQKIGKDDIWLDIACNDGTLLSFVPKECTRIGCDPADDTYKWESIRHAQFIIQEFFSKEVFKHRLPGKKAKVITSIAMFYDVPDPKQFIQDVYEILEDDGIWIMQLSYSPLMMEQMAFDNICHEHIYYYTLSGIIGLLAQCGFLVDDCELNDINGGSMRLYIKKRDKVDGDSSPNRYVKKMRITSLLENEITYNYDTSKTWIDWFSQIEKLKLQTRLFIISAVSDGKKVWGYGASTKGNTLLQYFGLDNTVIEAIAERNPSKHGLRTIGSNIPIKSEEEMREAQPDYLLILPWHFISEFANRESEYLRKGGKFIVPCPSFQIISHDTK